jgi:SAM-dependent methyltransferase
VVSDEWSCRHRWFKGWIQTTTWFVLLLLNLLCSVNSFVGIPPLTKISPSSCHFASTSTDDISTATGSYAPRTGLAQTLLNWALESPLWKYVLVPQARNTMVTTAEANGIEWRQAKAWIEAKQLQQYGGKLLPKLHTTDMEIPSYYQQGTFHAYEQGNLCWDAALEQEIASRAVGARNFPNYGPEGDTAFRQSFWRGMIQAGAKLPEDSTFVVAVDMGCGTGLSSRQLATTEFEGGRYIDKVIGLDLSPYYIEVGKTLLNLAPLTGMTQPPSSTAEPEAWINPIDERAKHTVELRVSNAEHTGMESNSVDIVQILFVLHELPAEAAANVIREAHRIVQPGGQVWIGEMDFQSPAYAAQRANALLFSLIRATEPYLDDYADGFVPSVKATVEELFETVVWEAATGRHYSMVATKGRDGVNSSKKKAIVKDNRFLPNGEYAIEDTHLQLWESKQEEGR